MSESSPCHTSSVRVRVLAHGESLRDVDGVGVVLPEAGATDVALRDGGGKRAGNKAIRHSKVSMGRGREGGIGEPWLLPLGIDEQRKTCLERGEEEE